MVNGDTSERVPDRVKSNPYRRHSSVWVVVPVALFTIAAMTACSNGNDGLTPDEPWPNWAPPYLYGKSPGPLANDATIRLGFPDDEQPPSAPTSVESTNADVLTARLSDGRIEVQTHNVGRASLLVEGSDWSRESEVEVADVAESDVLLLPFGEDTLQITMLLGDTLPMRPHAVALVVGAQLDFSVLSRDTEGRPLLGRRQEPLTVTPADHLVTYDHERGLYTLTASATTGYARVVGTTVDFSVVVISADTPVSLGLHGGYADAPPLSGTITVPDDLSAASFLALNHFTEDGLFVVGIPQEPLDLQPTGSGQCDLEVALERLGLSSWWTRQRERYRIMCVTAPSDLRLQVAEQVFELVLEPGE